MQQMQNHTLVILNPDCVRRGLVGEVLSRFERRGFTLGPIRSGVLSADLLAEHYREHLGQPFYPALVEFMTSGPAVVLVVQGPEGIVPAVRMMLGATNPMASPPGTIRGDFATTPIMANLVHASDSAEAADRERAIFFPEYRIPA